MKMTILTMLKKLSIVLALVGLPLALVHFYATSGGDTKPEKVTDMHQQLGITHPAKWDFIISEEEFAKIHQHTYAVILALKFGTVIYKDIDGKIVTIHQDIAITANQVICPWNYKENTMDKNVTHKHPKRPKSQQGTGLKVHNVLWLENQHESRRKGPNKGKLYAIIVSTGMDDELGVADRMTDRYQRTIDEGSEKEIKEFHVLNSREVPKKYLELLNKYKGGVSVLLHITC